MKNSKNQKPVRKPLKELTLLDRFLFDTAMSDPNICRNILSIIFGDKEVPSIRIGIAEKTEEPYYDSRAVRMVCDEVPELSMDDGAVRIFLNTHGENDDEVSPGLVEFLHYVENPEQREKEIQDERVRKLAGQIDMLKNSQEVGVKYMRLWEELEEARREGHDAGLTEGQETERLASIRKLMEIMEWTAEQAMDALEIPMEERKKYRN